MCGCRTCIDVGHVWMYAKTFIFHAMCGYRLKHLYSTLCIDVRHAWMYAMRGCTPCVDVGHVWMYAMCGCTPCVDVRHVWM